MDGRRFIKSLKKRKNEVYSDYFSASTDMDVSTKAKKILISLCKETIVEAIRFANATRGKSSSNASCRQRFGYWRKRCRNILRRPSSAQTALFRAKKQKEE
jgi:hypothetical protein